MTLAVRPISYSDADFASIIAEAPDQGGAFLLRMRDEWIGGTLRFERPGEFLLGAFRDGRLVGVGGVSLDPYHPAPRLGRVRHVYVLKECRGQGIGRALMLAILERARGRFETLRLKTSSAGAAKLYESLGFSRSEQDGETHRLAKGIFTSDFLEGG